MNKATSAFKVIDTITGATLGVWHSVSERGAKTQAAKALHTEYRYLAAVPFVEVEAPVFNLMSDAEFAAMERNADALELAEEESLDRLEESPLTEEFTTWDGFKAIRYLRDDVEQGIAAGSEFMGTQPITTPYAPTAEQALKDWEMTLRAERTEEMDNPPHPATLGGQPPRGCTCKHCADMTRGWEILGLA